MHTTKILRTLLLAGVTAFLFLHARPAFAATLPYDENNIIRDDIFTNSSTMSANDIQTFLNNNGSCLATASPADLGSPSGQTAAQIIALAASNANGGSGINPQVILTTLQKEWSLITKSCASLETLYGGYSGGPQVYLKRALGYDVPDVLGIGDCLYTFYNQLMGANCSGSSYMGGPSAMRSSYDNNHVGPGGAYAYPQSFVVQEYRDQPGNVTITPHTKATAVLYRYTPYAYYGNYNFFNIFQTFFGNPVCSANLTVIRAPGIVESSVLFNGVRYPIASLNALQAWGLDCVPVTNVDQPTYTSYPTGDQITQVFKEIEGPQVYIAQNGLRRHIRTPLYVNQFNLQNEPVGQLPAALIAQIPEGDPLGFLVQASGHSEIYLAQGNVKYYIPSIPVIEAWGFPISELVTVNPIYLDLLPTAGNLSTLVKGSGPDIYVATLRSFAYVPSPSRIQDWNMQNLSVTQLDDYFLQSLPKISPLSRLTRGSGVDTYYIANNKRYYVASIPTAVQLEQQYGPLTPMADTTIASIPFVGTMP